MGCYVQGDENNPLAQSKRHMFALIMAVTTTTITTADNNKVFILELLLYSIAQTKPL